MTNEKWFVGGNGNWFADMAGYRYCVALIDACNNASGFLVMRNGIEIAGPTPRAPAGFRTCESAKQYAEDNAERAPLPARMRDDARSARIAARLQSLVDKP